MNQPMAKQTETEVLKTLLANPSRFYSFQLKPKFFTDQENQKVMALIDFKMQEKGSFGITDLIEIQDQISISNFFAGSDVLEVNVLSNYVTACESIVKNYVQIETEKLLGNKATPEEIKEKIESLMLEGKKKNYVNLDSALAQYSDNYAKIQDRKKDGMGIGILTCWPKFNAKVGLRHQDFLVVGARPSIGKTAFGINLALESVFNDQTVLFVSCEMGVQTLLDRFLALASKINISQFRYANVVLGQFKPQLEAFKDKLHFMFEQKITSVDIMTAASSMPKLDLVIVDYLQLLSDEMRKGETENNRIARISSNLKQLGVKKNCAVVALAQLNRGNEKEKREPRLSDLRDSGSIEQDADTVILLHRDERDSFETLARVAKNRNGEIGDLAFNFNLKTGEFVESNPIFQD